jgi:hypothetical protein
MGLGDTVETGRRLLPFFSDLGSGFSNTFSELELDAPTTASIHLCRAPSIVYCLCTAGAVQMRVKLYRDTDIDIPVTVAVGPKKYSKIPDWKKIG